MTAIEPPTIYLCDRFGAIAAGRGLAARNRVAATQGRIPGIGSFPEWNVTAYGPPHRVMGTDQQTLGEFPPGATLDWSDQIEAQKPVKSVKVTYAGVKWSKTVTTPSDYPSFPVKGAHYTGGYSGTVTGTLRNPYPRAFSGLAITALFFRGSKLLSGGTDFVDHFPAHSPGPSR